MARTRPEDRYQSPLDLATEIERWLADEPVAAYREPFWSQALRTSRRKCPWGAGAAVLLVLAVATLLLGIIVLGKASARPAAHASPPGHSAPGTRPSG